MDGQKGGEDVRRTDREVVGVGSFIHASDEINRQNGVDHEETKIEQTIACYIIAKTMDDVCIYDASFVLAIIVNIKYNMMINM